MKISIITLFPKMISGFFEESIVKRAIGKKLVDVQLINLRDFALDDYGTVDDRPYGGGAGMVLRVDVMHKALHSITNYGLRIKTILTSPKGKEFTQKKAQEYATLNNLIIVAGHYEGVDERVRDFIDEEVSLGDFVMTGGEITAAAIADSVVRLVPGVLKKEEATQFESFFEVPIDKLIDVVGEDELIKKLKNQKVKTVRLLEYPHYTRPVEFDGKKVPEVLVSGHHKDIEKWRIQKAFEETLKKRPDLLASKVV